ncbi:LysR family transcriptional regulator [Paenibacillus sp. HN-1]|uniref:LysR family transcriptional regulator n=1 Tax=Paenibacillus TaxID=44249 RepID=UPI001CA85F2D|nr:MULTISPECIES: LysR family transcriptional regulator [Paenibacillus]MBY9078564.1 LysR family transcriptional regulator [Paenibacillus sp. CGMCC 1.18879]MBY9084788.1 LysR family transcriptional regulator [Paenibacillus sinensis]
MDIGLLKVFMAVAEEGSISKAAQSLNYVQSNVTARIQQLEQELNTPLFYRHSRGITLTSAGQTLMTYTEKILNLLEEAEKAVVDSPIPKGSITVGSDTTAAIRLPPILSAYRGKFPEVEVQLEIGLTDQLINSVLQYSVNGAFVDGPVEHPDIVQELIINERLGLIIPETMDFGGLRTIQDKTLLILNLGCMYRMQLEEWLRDEGYRLAKVMQFGTMEGLLGCVKAGIGYAVLPVSYYNKLNVKDGIRCYPFPERYGEVPTVFIRRRDLYMTSAFHQFIEELKEQLPEALTCGAETSDAK